MPDQFKFAEKVRLLEAAKVQLPRVLANTGQRFFQQNFDKAQWDGTPWEGRKDETNDKALLVASGRLRQAMQNTIKNANWSEIKWSVNDVSYAKYQHFGTDTIPARPFIGESKELMLQFEKKIDQQMKKILNIP